MLSDCVLAHQRMLLCVRWRGVVHVCVYVCVYMRSHIAHPLNSLVEVCQTALSGASGCYRSLQLLSWRIIDLRLFITNTDAAL